MLKEDTNEVCLENEYIASTSFIFNTSDNGYDFSL